MMKNSNKIKIKNQVTLDGLMTIGMLENGLHTADFECCEDAVMETFTARCKVQLMRDGNMYINELPKRVRNKPIFREDNSSLSKGSNGLYYFVFTLEEDLINQLPEKLISQASEIAQKVIRELINYKD